MVESIEVIARDFSGMELKRWTADVREKTEDYLVLAGEFDREIEHSHLGKIASGTVSYEYFWPGRWYNVFRFHEPTGEFRNYYCNINLPPVISSRAVEYVDLDLDVIVDFRGNWKVVDREDFESNAARFVYPADILNAVEASLEELIRSIDRREFPFDYLDTLQPNASNFVITSLV